MKLASNVRHLEVQVLADQYGNIIPIFGRYVCVTVSE
jgi:acetyl-CoA carboxylase/biotin carboxylase 1